MKLIMTGIIISLLLPLVISQTICETCMVDDPAMCPPECLGREQMPITSCGNGVCDPGEEGSCPGDCEGVTETTISKVPDFQPQTTTTNSIEMIATIIGEQTVIESTSTTLPATTEICGNSICGTGENCASCQADCACISGYECSVGSCVEKSKPKANLFVFLLLGSITVVGIIIFILFKSKPKKIDLSQEGQDYKMVTNIVKQIKLFH